MAAMSGWTITPDFQFDEGERDGRHGVSGYTWKEFTAKRRPPCPGCGEPVQVEACVLPSLGDEEDLYMPGDVSCLNGCQPPR